MQEKLYQQWRSSIDELRRADSKLFELETVATRDAQTSDKWEASVKQKEEDAIFNALWQR